MFMWYQQRPRTWDSRWRPEEVKKRSKDRNIFACGLIMLVIGLVGCAISLTLYFVGKESSQAVPEELSKQPNYTKPEKPNIIFITAEKIGWSDIRYGNPRLQVYTPYLDDLAKKGRILENHYVQHESVSSHHAFLTGRLPFKSKMQHGPFDAAAPYCTGSELTLISRTLKQQGYSTHAFGRWNLGFCSDRCIPVNRGFDHFFGHYTDKPNGTRYDWRSDDMTSNDLTDGGKFYTELLADRVIDTITAATEPFFVYLAFDGDHKHLKIPSRYTSYYPDCDEGTNSLSCLYMGDPAERRRNIQRRQYLALISAVDEAVGRITAAADDKTIIIFTPDTGGSHEEYANNLPLRGATGTLYEGGTKTRAIISGSHVQTLTPDNRHLGLFHATDWAATITSLAGLYSSSQYDGFDQSDMILFGLPSKRDHVIYNLDMEEYPLLGQSAIRVNKWKLIWGFDGVTNGRGYLRTQTYKTETETVVMPLSSWQLASLSQTEKDKVAQIVNERTWNPNDLYSGMIQLYNLEDDPNEYEDLSSDTNNAAMILQMKLMLTDALRNSYQKPPESFSQPVANLTDPADPGWC